MCATILLNDYRADDVPQEFLALYSGERYAACVAFQQGIIRWTDNSFSEEYLDIVRKLSEGLSQGLPELGPLR